MTPSRHPELQLGDFYTNIQYFVTTPVVHKAAISIWVLRHQRERVVAGWRLVIVVIGPRSLPDGSVVRGRVIYRLRGPTPTARDPQGSPEVMGGHAWSYWNLSLRPISWQAVNHIYLILISI